MKKGNEYEILIEKLYKKLDQDSVIKRNDKIYGHNSETFREIDLSIRRNIGIHPILLIVQARDRSRKVDVNAIAEFKGVIDDVKANGGIFISTKGFYKPAISLAKKYNIDVLTGHDLSNPNWAIDYRMPVILSTYEGSYTVSFILEASQEYADLANSGKMPKAPPWTEWKISDDNGRTFHSIAEKVNFLCGYDHLGFYDGKEHTALYEGILQLQVNNDVMTPLKDFKFIFNVTRKVYYKYFEVKQFEGLINRSTNVISRANVVVESDDFLLHNFDLIQKREIDLTTWNIYDENVNLIHPYHMRCMSLKLGVPNSPLKIVPGQ